MGEFVTAQTAFKNLAQLAGQLLAEISNLGVMFVGFLKQSQNDLGCFVVDFGELDVGSER